MGRLICLAFHYRDFQDPLDPGGNRHQACWKRFHSEVDAIHWLDVRSAKVETSPKGRFLFYVSDALTYEEQRAFFTGVEKHVHGKPFCDNLKRGIEAYLKYIQR